MKIFAPLYDKALEWSKHPQAERYLAALSFAESSFFPVPTILMMAPMALARPQRAWWLASLTTITSVLGGIAGYLIGMYLFDSLGQPIIDFYHAQDKFDHLQTWFDQWGIWVVLLAGVSPIPYKLFTLSSGLLGLAFIPFVLASLVGRSIQFFLAAAIAYFGGASLEDGLRKWIDWLGWGVLVLAVAAYFILR